MHPGFDSEKLLDMLSRRKDWMHRGKIKALKGKDSTADVLWANLCMNSPLMCFWKDKNRRFAGASQSFLRYYGLSSVDELIGKIDEDMHWHIANGPFHDDEVEVLTQGKSIIGARGTCIVGGENSIIFWLIRCRYTRMARLSVFWGSLWIWNSSLQMRKLYKGAIGRSDNRAE